MRAHTQPHNTGILCVAATTRDQSLEYLAYGHARVSMRSKSGSYGARRGVARPADSERPVCWLETLQVHVDAAGVRRTRHIAAAPEGIRFGASDGDSAHGALVSILYPLDQGQKTRYDVIEQR
jgi:hypothetical protein